MLLFGDAALIAAGTFVTLSALALAIRGLFQLLTGDTPLWLDGFGALATFAPVIVGPVAAWTLGGRKLSWSAIVGFVAGLVATAALGAALVLAVTISTGSTEQFPVWLIVLAATALLAFVGICAVASAAAWRDLRSDPPASRALDILGLLGFALVVVLITVVAIVMIQDPTSEGGEALAFGVIMGFASGLMVLGADLVDGFVSRRAHGTAAGGAH
jgi:hypothetical protein